MANLLTIITTPLMAAIWLLSLVLYVFAAASIAYLIYTIGASL